MDEKKILDEKTLEGVAGGMPSLGLSAEEINTYTDFCMEFRRSNCNHCARSYDCVYAEDNEYAWMAMYHNFSGSSTCPMKEEHP